MYALNYIFTPKWKGKQYGEIAPMKAATVEPCYNEAPREWENVLAI